MASLLRRCLLALTYISLTVGQECGNSAGDCPSITNIAQCTAEIVAVCCTKCNELAGCSNFASNCYSDYSADSCYQEEVQNRCCQMCKHYQKDYLGSSCLYGDLDIMCTKSGCGISADYDETCCESCYSGTTPDIMNVTVVVPETTTGGGPVEPVTTVPVVTTAGLTFLPTQSEVPDLCTDVVSSCANTIESVPSTCYNEDLRQRCCASCALFLEQRASAGYNVSYCPYGDRASHCVADFQLADCSMGDNQYLCCDTCNMMIETTAVPCEDSGTISCNLDSSNCYTSFYEEQCCATCRAYIRPNLDYTCRYGDSSDQCDSLITFGQVCSPLEESVCCEACANALLTTTPDPCQDDSPSCAQLVGGIARNCYNLEDFCCRSCRPFVQEYRPESCKYGDVLPICTIDTCDLLESQCCATCADRPPTTTTRPPCSDASDQCMNGIYNLANEPKGCYRTETRDACCNSCRMLEIGTSECLYGNKETLCSQLNFVDCTDAAIREICCGECGGLITSRPETTTTPELPPDCEDMLDTCDQLTTESLYSCYEGAFLAGQCCASCYRKRKVGLPEGCEFGDRIQSCSVFIRDSSLCMQDPVVRKDCCATCYSYETTTAASQATICPNVFGDSTCETLLSTLEGDCSSIQDVCCRTCYSTTTSAPTTMMITTEACEDNFGSFACATIITNEGEEQCYTDYMAENCCASCRAIITTVPPTTTGPVCPGDALPNCAAIQALVDDDICEDISSFRQSCCEFCGDNESPPTTMGTTTLPPGCDGNVWPMDVCAASVTTSPLDDPCENSDLIWMNCCAYCSMVTTVTMTTRSMTTAGPVCTGDDPSINCESLDALPSFDVCADDALRVACCDYCNPETPTTVVTTPTRGLCSFNLFSIAECQSLVDSSNGLICATDLMVDNCCLFCSTLTFPPTTTTEAPCMMDNPDVNCTDLDDQFGGNLCTELVNPALRDECCFYCGNLPTTTTTGPPTTTICVDLLDELSCIALANIGNCDKSFGLSQCCATCAILNAPTTTESTTTTQTMPTTACIDTGVLNCTALALGGIVDPCTAEDAVRDACCAFCQNRTTLAPPITPGPCFGNAFASEQVCINRESTNPNFCMTDEFWLGLCCEFCGAPVIQQTTTGPEATTVTTSMPAATTVTTASPTECEGNKFALVLCDSGISSDPSRCQQDIWYSQCCEYCDNLAAQQSRRKRSIESENLDSFQEIALDLSRVRRQTPACVTVDEQLCEAFVYSSNTNPKSLICAESFFPLEDCCEYCVRVSDEGAIPRGKHKDTNGGLLAKLFGLN
ncbi:uncharacterized protein [Watersipora subatra]|uniref:uncharacterized protein isoform X2 n=1 Tax=Watersipora subatra TaxID=2589382 RepID=UPI00355C3C52